MSELLLPKNSKPTPERIKQLETALSRLISNDPRTIDDACGFYDVIDKYLGPWGVDGYPIGYGKYYCVAFNMNQKLRRSNTAWGWVIKTTKLLQTSLKDFIVARYRAGTLAGLTESDLRKHAFDSHPAAYTEGGLTSIILYGPETIPIITSIPGAEFSTSSKNFDASIKQLFVTAGLQAPRVMTSIAALPSPAFIEPAHSGILSRGVKQSMSSLLKWQSEVRGLAHLLERTRNGDLDNLIVLDSVIKQLEYRRYADPGLRRTADAVIAAAKKRKEYVKKYYQSLPKGIPTVPSVP